MSFIDVNVSNSFPSRSRCKGCGKKPDTNDVNALFRNFRSFYRGACRGWARPFMTTSSYDYERGYYKKKIFHYDIYEDNGIDGTRFFGVKLSIGGKVIAKARATSKKKAEEKASQRTYFALQEKMDKK